VGLNGEIDALAMACQARTSVPNNPPGCLPAVRRFAL
jgi:hypothetical protein